MNGEHSPLRIGNAERESAMRALDEHLAAGRLDVHEYAERSAAAANAVVAADLTALFTDLPEPHPQLPPHLTAPPAPQRPTGSTGSGALARWAQQIVPIAVVVAIGLFLTLRAGPVFLLITVAAVAFWLLRRT